MTVEFHYFTDPACENSWGNEPTLRRLFWEFEGGFREKLIMAGLARQFEGEMTGRMASWLETAASSGMPFDPLIWTENPLTGTYPACMAVKAAGQQGSEAEWKYLRHLREGIMCGRRRLDHADALGAVAGEAGLDVNRFRLDFGSSAILEEFGNDLERDHEFFGDSAAGADSEGPRRLPSARFRGEDGVFHDVHGPAEYELLRATAITAGAIPVRTDHPDVDTALEKFGRLAEAELLALTGLPEPVLLEQLWSGAKGWKYQAEDYLTGRTWHKS